MDEILEQTDMAQLAYATSMEKAKQLALKYLSARMRTKTEIEEFLSKKGYDGKQIEDVVAFLVEYQYLDDAVYCRAWIHDRIQFHPCGRQKMAFELSKKVSDRQLVAQSLELYFSVEQELELAQQAAELKLRSRIGKSVLTREQLARFLYNRGYSSSIIVQVLDTLSEAWNSVDEYE